MKRLLSLGLCCILAAGCAYSRSTALYKPMLNSDGSVVSIQDADGNVVAIAATMESTTKIVARNGAQIEKAAVKKSAKKTGPGQWEFKDQMEAEGWWTPDTMKEAMTALDAIVQNALTAYTGIKQKELEMEAAKPPEESPLVQLQPLLELIIGNMGSGGAGGGVPALPVP